MANGNRSLGRGLGDLIEEVSTVKAIQTPPAPVSTPTPPAAEPPQPAANPPPANEPTPTPARKPSRWPVVVIALLAVGWIGSLLLLSSRQNDLREAVRTREQKILDLESELTHQARELAIDAAPPVTPVVVDTTPAVNPLEWAAAISIPGVRTEPGEGVVKLVFDNPVFAFRTEVHGDAQPILMQVASVLAANAASCLVTVVGHTDNDPVRKGGPYRDNLDLALQRATTVLQLLRTDGAVPAESLAARAAPDTASPYPNDSHNNKVRNRTVTLEIRAR